MKFPEKPKQTSTVSVPLTSLLAFNVLLCQCYWNGSTASIHISQGSICKPHVARCSCQGCELELELELEELGNFGRTRKIKISELELELELEKSL